MMTTESFLIVCCIITISARQLVAKVACLKRLLHTYGGVEI